MKNIRIKVFVFLIYTIMPAVIFAAHVDITIAGKAASALIKQLGMQNGIKSISPVQSNNTVLFYKAELTPLGYMILSADDNLPPVIAYSFDNNMDNEEAFLQILKTDIAYRQAAIDKLPTEKIIQRKAIWAGLLANTSSQSKPFQQWPPNGTTTTGGWLETNWTQSSPYNQMCPIDPVTSTRSYTGCPATTMAQILNYHKTTNNTHFDDGDDYYHNYSGRTFWIDNDYALHGFPSFTQLNGYLDDLNTHYKNNTALTNNDKASLMFACGVAAQQVYSSQGSGTYAVSQAYDAYQRFGFNTAELLYTTDSTLYARLAQNMKDSLPAHLALVDDPVTTGHNLVVDGYNTNNYYHVNFGWGGSNNGWYILPDEMPYSLTVIEGLIVDIIKSPASSVQPHHDEAGISIYPNPAKNQVVISSNLAGKGHFELYDLPGLKVLYSNIDNAYQSLDLSDLKNGTYIYLIKNGKDEIIKTGKLVLIK